MSNLVKLGSRDFGWADAGVSDVSVRCISNYLYLAVLLLAQEGMGSMEISGLTP